MEITGLSVRSALIIVSVTLFMCYAAVRMLFPKMFYGVYSAADFFSLRQKDEFTSGIKLLSTENVVFTFLLAGTLSFLTLVLLNGYGQFLGVDTTTLPQTWGNMMLWWLAGILVFSLLFILKFVFIWLFGWLFDFPAFVSRHYHEYQSMSQYFYLLFAVAVSVSLYSQFYFAESLLYVLALILCAFGFYRLINLYIKLYAAGGFSMLFIFSYLCSTELIPLAITIGILLK